MCLVAILSVFTSLFFWGRISPRAKEVVTRITESSVKLLPERVAREWWLVRTMSVLRTSRGHPVLPPRGFGLVHGELRGRRDGPQHEAPFLVMYT